MTTNNTHVALSSAAHYDLMVMFEKEFSGFRLDKEPKELWPQGNIYQSGETNNLFLAYRRGAAYGAANALASVAPS